MESNLKRITAVLGPTNTGKTHLAVETLFEYESGIMGFPLRSVSYTHLTLPTNREV